MKDLKVIENELVPVYETSTGEKVVYGTELHGVLEVKSKFADWIKNRLNDCEAVENEDFETFSKNLEKGRPSVDYIIKLDIAKEMAMLERNAKGKQVRRYFIQIEKKYKEKVRKLSAIEQIQLNAQAVLEVHEEVRAVNEDLQQFKQDMPILGIEEDNITNAVKKRGVKCLGGKSSSAYKDHSLRQRLYQDIYRELKRQFGIGTYKAIKRNQCDLAIQIIEGYEPPLILAEQISDCNAQMNMGRIWPDSRALKLI